MQKTTILIIDDDPDIRDVLKITLTEEGFEVIEACDGQEGLLMALKKSPDLIIVDYKMPKMDGRQVCQEIKKDILTSHMPIIMLTGKSELADKVGGIEAGADDYIVKPFEPQELIARIKMTLRKTQRDLEANPLTKLPGNVSILKELERRIEQQKPFAVCYADLDKFKAYNDKYGFEHGDEVIKETARILIRVIKELGNPDDFIGHIGGDDFVFVTTPDKIDLICSRIIEAFDQIAPSFYSQQDREAGFIITKDRQGQEQKVPLLSISIGVVTNEKRKITHVGEIGEIGAELKKQAKSKEGSTYLKDLRQA